MTRVDSKGRIVLPQEVRERLGITPGTEVEVHEESGRAIVEPEENPERIIADLESMIAGSSHQDRRPYDKLRDESKRHVDTIRGQAAEADDE